MNLSDPFNFHLAPSSGQSLIKTKDASISFNFNETANLQKGKTFSEK